VFDSWRLSDFFCHAGTAGTFSARERVWQTSFLRAGVPGLSWHFVPSNQVRAASSLSTEGKYCEAVHRPCEDWVLPRMTAIESKRQKAQLLSSFDPIVWMSAVGLLGGTGGIR